MNFALDCISSRVEIFQGRMPLDPGPTVFGANAPHSSTQKIFLDRNTGKVIASQW